MSEIQDNSVGKLPTGWVMTTVGEIYDIVGGGTPSTKLENYWKGDVPWITSADIHGLYDIAPRKFITREAILESATHVVPEGSIIVVTRVGLGKVGLSKEPICFSQDCQGLVGCNSLVDPQYSLYYLSSAVQRFMFENRGTTISGVTKTQLSRLPFLLPPLAEQRRIVAKIEALSLKMNESATQIVAASVQLRPFRQSLFRHALEGRLTEKWRARNVRTLESAKKLLGRIDTERKHILSKEPNVLPSARLPELADLPETWCWATWSDVGISQNGRAFPSKSYESDGVKLLRPGNLFDDGKIRWTHDNTRYLPVEYEMQYPGYVIRGNELIMNLTAQSLKDEFLGRVCITDSDEHCLLNQRLARLTPVLINPRFVFLVFKSPLFRRFVRGLNQGSLIQHMFTRQLSNFYLPIPPLEEQEQIVRAVESRMNIVDKNADQLLQFGKKILTLHQSILKHAFNGKLVSQNLGDEPADIPLKRIREERRRIPEERTVQMNRRKRYAK